MARRAVRLLLAVVLAAVLFHTDAVVEGKDQAPAMPKGVIPYHRCGSCEVHVTKAQPSSPLNKEPLIGIPDNVCKQVVPVADDDVLHQLIFQEQEQQCHEKCKTIIERAWQVMKHDDDIVGFIYDKKPSIQRLMQFLCNETPHSTEGEDHDNESYLETKVKNGARIVKNGVRIVKNFIRHKIVNFLQTSEEPTNRIKACKNLNASLE